MRLDSRGMRGLTPVAARNLNFALSATACVHARYLAKKLARLREHDYDLESGKVTPHRFGAQLLATHEALISDATKLLGQLRHLVGSRRCYAADRIARELVLIHRSRRHYNRALTAAS